MQTTHFANPPPRTPGVKTAFSVDWVFFPHYPPVLITASGGDRFTQ
jgi:hypothetical protein